MKNLPDKPLSGIRVLELSRIMAGPWAGQVLADLGAEVIKVERPGTGDDTRTWGPPFLKTADGEETKESAYYLAANRGKKSVCVDMATPEGRALIAQLAEKSDILIENFKVGGLTKYGLDYSTLKKLHPGLIYASITGFGQTGPNKERAGYDVMIQAMGGLMSITGEADGEPGGGPMKVGIPIVDLVTGLYTVIAVQAALRQQEATGAGQHIDMALFDVQVGLLANQASNYLISGNVPQRMGSAHPNIAPYQSFATKDGHLLLAVGNDGQFAKFCKVAGQPGLAEDSRFATNAQRVLNRADLIPLVANWMAQKTTAEWETYLGREAVPCGPINDIGEVFAQDQIEARGLKLELPHPASETVPMAAPPLRMNGQINHGETAPPQLGQHTHEVLSSILNIKNQEIDRLRIDGVIA